MKIVIGLIVVVGLGWLLLSGGEPEATPDTTGEVMEEGEAMMEEGEGHDGDAMEGEAMEEGDAMMEEEGEAMEEETPAI